MAEKIVKSSDERGALMLEAIALLGLMTMMSPMVVRQTADRTSEMEEVAVAGQMKTLRDAVSRYGYQKGLILHSDHGSQYTSQEYRTMLAGFGSIRQSMGRTHCCFDNARMESFFATLKKELVYRLKCSTMKRDEVRKIIFRWIETYYNRRRRNTANELNLPPLVKRARFADHSFAA